MDIDKKPAQPTENEQDAPGDNGDNINVSGHVQELDRNFGVFSICCIAIMNNNAWASGGGSLVIALYNGGGPGVLYGLMAATFFYAFISLSLAELVSAIPSSANVYHWASVTAGPKYGRICSWFGGWWNSLAWIFGTSSVCLFCQSRQATLGRRRTNLLSKRRLQTVALTPEDDGFLFTEKEKADMASGSQHPDVSIEEKIGRAHV